MTIVGELRPSQLINSFGPGAIVDLPDDSVVVYDIKNWKRGRRVEEPRLARFLSVNQFYTPADWDEKNGDIPVCKFPLYRVCTDNRCNALSQNLIDGRCARCNATTHPARVVVACASGHLDDFPWVEWAHRKSGLCQNPTLTLRSLGLTSSLADIEVRCTNCKDGHQTMSGALGEFALREVLDNCSARRPWLPHDDKSCARVPRAILRGASNVYFPALASSIAIPRWSTEIMEFINEIWPSIYKIVEEGDEDPDAKVELKLYIKRQYRESVEQYGLDDILAAIEQRHKLQVDSLQSLLFDEWQALFANESSRDFKTNVIDTPKKFQEYIGSIILVERLREIRALRGFTRILAGDAESNTRVAPLTASGRLGWLPCLETRGEGIFLSLDERRLQEWEASAEQHRRYQSISRAYEELRQSLELPPRPPKPPRYILLHTLSHLLMRQLSLVCGYSSASLKERLYVGPNMAGLLIYTASQDADGSLGGLIQQGSGDRMEALLFNSLITATGCSSDPLCREHEPWLRSVPKGAACHACALSSETSCECSNRLLDRGHVVTLPEVESIPYFELT